MTLYERLSADMKTAMKRKDKPALSALRLLITAVHTAEIEKNVKELGEPDIVKIIQKQIKQRKDSIEQFEKGNRPDLVRVEKSELDVLNGYLPQQLSREELVRLIDTAIIDTSAKSKKDAGAVMKAVLSAAAGRADGKLVNQLVMERLPQNPPA